MFTACFDASGHEKDQKFVVVAGFISSADDWRKFENQWQERLLGDGISCFHMSDFAASRGEFKLGWKNNEKHRQELLRDLMEIIRSFTYRRFLCAVEIKVFLENFSESEKEEYYLGAYALAGMTCAEQVYRWYNMEKISAPLEFVFEDGDSGKGKLIDSFREAGLPEPRFCPKRDIETKIGKRVGFAPLQAADWLAYEVFEGCKNRSKANYKPRWPLEQFAPIIGYDGIYTVSDLQRLREGLRVCIDTFNWWEKISGKSS